MAMVQMLAIDVAAVVIAVVCIVRRRAARRSHARRVREILGRPAAKRSWVWRRRPISVVVSSGAPAREVLARSDLRTPEQKRTDQAGFDTALPRGARVA